MTKAPKADDDIEEAKEVFDLCRDREAENRRNALDDILFALNDEQWPEGIREQRTKDKRPCLTINRLRPTIRQVVNDARQNKPSIKVHPVDDKADPETADIFNGLIRNIEVTSKADVAYDTALESAVAGGVGYFRINTKFADDDTFDIDLVFEAIPNPFSVYGDPYSTASDSSDWNLAFVQELVPDKVFEAKYKGAEKVDWQDDGYDRLESPWREDESVRVCEYWKREEAPREIVMLSDGSVISADIYKAQRPIFDAIGVSVAGQRTVRSHKVTQTLMTGAEVLEKRDWPGRYIPIVPVYGDVVNIEGKRILRSLIRGSKDAQMMFNFWRTASTEMIALAPKAPFIGPKGAFITDQEKWETANTETHPYIEYDGGIPPARQPFAGPASGAMQEALSAADDIKATTGIFNEALGQQSNAISGVAIKARQREGDVSTFHFIDNLARGVEHGGRILVDLIPQLYTQDRIIRVLGQDGKPTIVPLGKPTPVPGPDGKPQMQPAPPAPGSPPPEPGAPPPMVPVTKVYDLSVGKYDLTVETGPSYTTQREEAADSMAEFIQALPQAGAVIGDLYAKAQDWPDADIIAERLEAMLPPQVKGLNPEVQQAQQQAQQQVQMAQQHVAAVTQQAQGIIAQKSQNEQALQQQVQQLQAQLAAKGGDQRLKGAELNVKAYDAETKRILAEDKVKASQLDAAGKLGFLPGAFDPQAQQPVGAPQMGEDFGQ